ncbi:homoserine kinase [Cellulomonas marina]|uniref:Homoserine kinase n=1 Tax=Cellulomonas marina TaxID=988821 RepID=A0A1I1AXN8_9CELL|nr:homoserine kinase [Cellulomonas marina]GIG30256.1 homoserine kinase [Cellulomonas marina]SFB41043.1 homoserine kinase [Cellulomonas marina]
MRLRTEHVRVRVPATSANLGPGYDALGLALDLQDEVEVWAHPRAAVTVEVVGEGAGEVADDERHLVARALLETLDEVGAPRTGLHLRCTNRIPHGRGLGSSAAAVVGGILAARALLGEPDELDAAAVLTLATRLEGHPDNAAPAVLGGLTLAWTPGPHAVGLPLHPSVVPLVAVPPVRLATARARSVLPAQVPHADAAFALARAALLVEALGRRPELLLAATADRLHQEYRREVMPDSLALVDVLRRAGVPAVVSGAGPTVLVLGVRDADGRVPAAEALDAAFGGAMVGWRVLSPGVATRGGHAVGA